jgi:hypothetical protein
MFRFRDYSASGGRGYAISDVPPGPATPTQGEEVRA